MSDLADIGFRVDTKGLIKGENALNKLDKAGAKAEKGAAKFGKAYAAAGLVVVAALTKSIAVAIKFEKAMAEVSTLVDTSIVSMDGLAESVKDVNAQFGGGLEQQASALYNIISSGAEAGAESAAILTQANKLALGGVTDLETAADGLTSALNAYGAGADEATAFSDSMFVAMKAGKTTIGELSAVVGQTAPIASQLGVSFDELEASISALTTTGLKTAQAGTQIQAIFTSLLKPTKEAADEAERLGLEFNSQALEAKGLAGFLADVKDKTGGSKDSMARLFGSVEAVKGIMALTGEQAQTFADILEDMGEKAGETDKAVSKMTETFDQQFKIMIARIENAEETIGGFLKEVILPMIVAFNNATASVDGLAKAFFNTFSASIAIRAIVNQATKEVDDFDAALGGVDFSAFDDAPTKIKKTGDAFKSAASSMKIITIESTKADDAIEDYLNTLKRSQLEIDLVVRKQALLWQAYREGVIGIEAYNEASKDLGLAMDEVAEKSEKTATEMTQAWDNMIVDIQRGWGDLFTNELTKVLEDFGIKADGIFGFILDSFLSMIGKMAAAWATEAIFGGGLGSANALFAPVIASAKVAAGKIGSILGVGASAGVAEAAVGGGAIYTGTVGPAAAATSGGSAAAISGLGVAAGVAGVAILGMMHNRSESAKVAEEANKIIENSTSLLKTNAVTMGVVGDKAGIAFGKSSRSAQFFESAMKQVNVQFEDSRHNALVLTSNLEVAQAVAAAWTDEAVSGMRLQVQALNAIDSAISDPQDRMEAFSSNVDQVTKSFADAALAAAGLSSAVGSIPSVNISTSTDRGAASTVGATTSSSVPVFESQNASGTHGLWQTVPSGFNNDDYGVGMQSGEQFMVKSRADVSSGGGSDDRVVVRLDTIIAQNSQLQGRVASLEQTTYNAGQDNVDGHEDTLRQLQA